MSLVRAAARSGFQDLQYRRELQQHRTIAQGVGSDVSSEGIQVQEESTYEGDRGIGAVYAGEDDGSRSERAVD